MSLLAWVNVILLVYLALFPVIIEINKRVFKGKSKNFIKMMKYGRKIHPVAGILLIVSGLVHGYLMLEGNLIFHTGFLIVFLLVLNAVTGFIFKKKRIRKIALLHRITGVLIILSFLLHYFNPWYFSLL